MRPATCVCRSKAAFLFLLGSNDVLLLVPRGGKKLRLHPPPSSSPRYSSSPFPFICLPPISFILFYARKCLRRVHTLNPSYRSVFLSGFSTLVYPFPHLSGCRYFRFALDYFHRYKFFHCDRFLCTSSVCRTFLDVRALPQLLKILF